MWVKCVGRGKRVRMRWGRERVLVKERWFITIFGGDAEEENDGAREDQSLALEVLLLRFRHLLHAHLFCHARGLVNIHDLWRWQVDTDGQERERGTLLAFLGRGRRFFFMFCDFIYSRINIVDKLHRLSTSMHSREPTNKFKVYFIFNEIVLNSLSLR